MCAIWKCEFHISVVKAIMLHVCGHRSIPVFTTLESGVPWGRQKRVKFWFVEEAAIQYLELKESDKVLLKTRCMSWYSKGVWPSWAMLAASWTKLFLIKKMRLKLKKWTSKKRDDVCPMFCTYWSLCAFMEPSIIFDHHKNKMERDHEVFVSLPTEEDPHMRVELFWKRNSAGDWWVFYSSISLGERLNVYTKVQ